MILSRDRILTTHVGSLPRNETLSNLLMSQEAGESYDKQLMDNELNKAVRHVVDEQKKAGIDIGNDGEQQRVGFQTYIPQRMSGFGGVSQRRRGKEFEEFPELVAYLMRRFPHMTKGQQGAPEAQKEIRYLDTKPLENEIARFKKITDEAKAFSEQFMTAPSPGIIAAACRNEHYDTERAYLRALGEALRHEYEAVVNAGFVLQLDCPDLALEHHVSFHEAGEAKFLKFVEGVVETLNEAIRNIPPDRVRMHVCWGNYEGPHHRDVPLADIVDIVFMAKPQAISLEGANPRHAHEYTVFDTVKLPDGKVLIPGVLESKSNFIEHPELIAQRIGRYAERVGRENVMAGSDCGYGTWVGQAAVDPQVVWAKLAAMAEGARIATKRFWK